MGGLYIENNRFIYVDEEVTEVLLNCDDLISNYSRVPLQYLPPGTDSLPALVLDGLKEHKVIAAGTGEENADKEYATLEICVAKEHMKTPYELKVLEIGCTSGIMSYHLARLIGKYNEQSQLCCVTDTIGNESGNGWVDKISLLAHVPKLSFLATDYDAMPLPDGYFDVVIINGSISFSQKDEVLSEAVRVLKKDGVLLAYIVGDVDLIERVASGCKQLKSYMYLGDRCVLRIDEGDLLPRKEQISEVSYVKEEVVRLCEEMLTSDSGADELRAMIQRLDKAAQEAGEKRDLDSKVIFMEYKGKLLDVLVKKKR